MRERGSNLQPLDVTSPEVTDSCQSSGVLLLLRSLSSLCGCLLIAYLISPFSLALAVLSASLSPYQKAASLAPQASCLGSDLSLSL